MSIDERRRLALHRAAAGTWGEEVADTLAELVGPSGDEVATKDDVGHLGRRMDGLDQRMDGLDQRMDGLDHRMDLLDQRIDAMEQRWDERTVTAERRWDERIAAFNVKWDQQMEAMEHRIIATFERRISVAVTTQTRTLVFSQLSAVVVIAALAFGLR
jgi:hypothetical protein